MSENGEAEITPHDLIKKDYVEAALKVDKGDDAELLTYKVVDFTSKGDNYASVVTSVDVRYSQEGRESSVTYIVKCNPCLQNELFKEFTGTFLKKEAKFYKELLPALNKQLHNVGHDSLRLAKVFSATLTENEEIIILKDLRPNGYKMFDRLKGMDKAHCLLVLNELGRFHAASVMLQNELSEPIDEKYEFLKTDFFNLGSKITNDEFDTIFQGYFTNGASMAEKIGGYDFVATWLRNNKTNIGDMFKDSVKVGPPFNVVCHGDCWNNNLLFKYNDEGEPTDVRLLDLQLCRYASLATDLNYLMYTSLNGNDRKQNLDLYLRSYYESFCRVLMDADLKAPYTQEELRKEYHSKHAFGLVMGLMIVPLVVSKAASAFNLKDLDNSDTEAAMEQLHSNLLNQVDTNPLLRPRLLSMFDDMLEYGVIA